MRTIERFRIDDGPEGASKSVLVAAGSGQPQLVPGTHLEAQYAVETAGEPLYLLLTSHNSPFEEMIHILLLDERGALLEQADLGGPYAPGILKDLRVESP